MKERFRVEPLEAQLDYTEDWKRRKREKDFNSLDLKYDYGFFSIFDVLNALRLRLF